MSDPSNPNTLPLLSIGQAFELLKRDVQRTCLTQVGNARQLQEQIQACLRFENTITQVSNLVNL